MRNNTDEFLAAIGNRRHSLGQLFSVQFGGCEKCGEKHQIQLTDWLVVPAKWKCRKCKKSFELEPEGVAPLPVFPCDLERIS